MKTATVFFALWLGSQGVSATPLDTLCAQADKTRNCMQTGQMAHATIIALCKAAPECKAYVEAGLGAATSSFYLLGAVGATPVGQGNHDCYTRTAQDTFTKQSGYCSDASAPGVKATNYICKNKGPCTPTTSPPTTTKCGDVPAITCTASQVAQDPGTVGRDAAKCCKAKPGTCYELFKEDRWCNAPEPIARAGYDGVAISTLRTDGTKCRDWCTATATCKFYLFDQDKDCSLHASCDSDTNYVSGDTSKIYKRGCSACTSLKYTVKSTTMTRCSSEWSDDGEEACKSYAAQLGQIDVKTTCAPAAFGCIQKLGSAAVAWNNCPQVKTWENSRYTTGGSGYPICPEETYELYKNDIWCTSFTPANAAIARDNPPDSNTENYRSSKTKCQDWCSATATCKFYLFDQDKDCSLLANCDVQTNYLSGDTSTVYKRGCVEDLCASEETACMDDATCRGIADAANSYWTEWFNIDAPSGNADNEALELQPVIPHPCLEETPLEASCVRVSDGKKSTETGQVFDIPCGVKGLLCLNADNSAGCDDYKVKYRCPSAPSNTRTEDCAANQLCSKFVNCFTGPTKTCKSVGDPHVTPFEMAQFDNHATGWKTLYFKGNLKIQALQKTWLLSGGGSDRVAVNAGVRYTTKADIALTAASWLPPNGQTLENTRLDTSAAVFLIPHPHIPNSPITRVSSTAIKFPTNYLTSLTLKVTTQDFQTKRNIDPTAKFIYNIWITTNDFAGAKGQCAEGKVGQDARQRRSLEDSGGVPFPTLPPLPTKAQQAYFVTAEEAAAACKTITDVRTRTDCVTDVRMMNDPAYTAHIVQGFMRVEAVDRELEGKSGIGGWALGAAGKSCTAACQDFGATCNEEHLQSLKANPDGVRLAFADAGHPCKTNGHSCVTDGNKCVSYGAPFIHASNMKETACQSPGPGDESVANCAQVPIDNNHRRLCACGTPPTKPTAVKKVCSSVGDPHVQPFFGYNFDTHSTGWKVLYKKGNFEVQLLQDMWDRTSLRHIAINRAVKYTEDGTNWEKVGCELDEVVNCAKAGQLFSSSLGWIGFGTGTSARVSKDFINPNVNLLVQWNDFSGVRWTNTKKIYSVYVTTDQIEGSTGQCTEGKLRRRLSDGVEFPQGGISQADADTKCLLLGDMKRNCAYDVRMANDAAATPLVVDHFNEVERTLKSIQAVVISGKAPDDCSQQSFDFAGWCDFAAECDVAYAAAGLYLGSEDQRDGIPCPDGSKAVENAFAGVHTKKCCSCGGTFCAVTTTTTTPTTTTTTKTTPSGPTPDCTPVLAAEQAWRMWKLPTVNGIGVCKREGCSCEDMQRVWKVCTSPTDPNHAAVVKNCPVSCAKAQGKCQVKKPVKPPGPMKTCMSVGDPHIYPFDRTPFPGGRFDNHAVGWKTLYLKGDLMIQAHQKIWLTTRNIAINAAVRYTMQATGDLNAASTWQTPNGQTVENPSTAPFATSAALFAQPAPGTNAMRTSPNIIEFPDNFLTLQIASQSSAQVPHWWSLSSVIPGLGFFYDIWITTNDQAGAKGQCGVDGKAGQDAGMRRRSLEDSDGVSFPTGNNVKVTKEQAEAACAAISNAGLKTDCVTDARMINEPIFLDKVVGGFKQVEVVNKEIAEKFGITATVTASPTATVAASPTATVTASPTAITTTVTKISTVSSAIRTSVTFLIAFVLAVGFCV